MNIFDTAIAFILAREGGFSTDPNDPGNWTGGTVNNGTLKGTNRGISAASYPALDIKSLTEDDCKQIYRRDFFDKCRCGEMPAPIAFLLMDAAVNQGQPRAVMMLQQSLSITADGIAGPQTVAAAQRDFSPKLINELVAQRMFVYGTARNFQRFGLGWSRRLAACIALANTPVLF